MWTYDDYDKHREQLAMRLKFACAHNNMSYGDLARATGITEGTISCYMRGRNQPRTTNAALMAHALGVSLDWLGGLTDEWPF